MAVHFHQSSQFESIRASIEENIYDLVLEVGQDVGSAIKSIEHFAQAIEHLFDIQPIFTMHKPDRIRIRI